MDGVLIGSDDAAGDYTGTGVFRIGKHMLTAGYFNGLIDDVRIWNTARTQSEIQTNMNNCLMGVEPGLLAYYDMNDGPSSTTLSDKSGNGHHGTLMNMEPASDWSTNVATSCEYLCQQQLSTTATVTVNPFPTVTANASANTVCAGSQITLTGSGADSYSWDNGMPDGMAFTPTGTATYTVIGADVNGCTNTASINVTVNPLPTVTANTTASAVCSGSSVTLTGGGATSYSWNNGVTNGTAFTPSATTTYTVTGTDANNCSNTATTTVTVNALPTVTANTTASTVCAGSRVTLTGGGATSYSWDNGVNNGTAFTPSATTTYTVTGTDANNCSSTATATVTVNALPTVGANSTASSVCSGTPVTLTGSGAVSYSWDNGVTDGTAFTPSATTTYTVTGTDANNCSNTATTTVTVNALPSVTANTTASTVCAGDMVTLTGGGANAYTWDNGVTDGNAFTPASTTTYTVTGTDANTCSNTATVTVTVNVVDVTTSVNSITITANNAGAAYQWMNCDNNQLIANETSVSFTATANGNYAVIVTENGCTDTSACVAITGVGISETAANGSIRLYPNPNNGNFLLETQNAGKVEIFNALGQLILSENVVSGNNRFNLGSIGNGVYLISFLENDGDRTTMPMVITQ